MERGPAQTQGAVEARAKKSAESRSASIPGLEFPRYFTLPGVDPFDEIEWEIRSAVIGNEKGKVVFEQRDVEIPSFWSQQATNIVVSKYFRGQMDSPERERSVKQLVGRVVDTITRWAREQRYFASDDALASFSAELKHLLVYQKAAFNSPVWFNCGFEAAPQCSACFINSVKDTMDSILTLARTEGMLFKFGSGTGSNLSTIRSSRELLAGGGTASGPVSFMKGYDAFAGVIKSGGKTRRAAKMVILNAEHPDVEEFINCKVEEEKRPGRLSMPVTTARSRASPMDRSSSELEQQRARDRRLHARGARRWRVADEGGDDGRGDGHLQGTGSDAPDCPGDLGLRRPRHAVRHHRQRMAHLPRHRSHQREQSVFGIHVPG
jgi:ribonucleoside-diphosphate reductase alpha chain